MLIWLLEKLLAWQHARQRHIDVTTLWPSICEQTTDPELAVAAFERHAYHDPAWLSLTVVELREALDNLPVVVLDGGILKASIHPRIHEAMNNG